jgi:effector-binding domain-containing protein
MGVQLLTAQPSLIAAVRRRTANSDIPRVLIPGLDIIWAFIRRKGLAHGRNVAVYTQVDPTTVDMLCAVQVNDRFNEEGEVACLETPGGMAAMVTHVGPYNRMFEGYDAIKAWAQQNNQRLAAVYWEVYGRGNLPPDKLETDVYWLVG